MCEGIAAGPHAYKKLRDEASNSQLRATYKIIAWRIMRLTYLNRE